MKKGEERTALDFEWVCAGIEKRRANFSNVVCVETRDPVRWGQAKAYLVHSEEYRDAKFYLYEPWGGLSELQRESETSSKFEPVTRKAGGGYDSTIQEKMQGLHEALHFVEKELKSKKTVLFLQGLEEIRNDGKHDALAEAVRSWAHNPEVTVSGSLAVLFCGSTASVLDGFTSEFVALSRPPIAEPHERRKVLDEVAESLDVELDGTREALALATAGLNLHQLRSLLVETYHRKKSFPLDAIKDAKAEIIRRSDVLETHEPGSKGFEAVGGYGAAKRFITANVAKVLQDPERARRFALPLPRGILLFGPPGTGKTLFAKALASETNLPFLRLRAENLFSKYVGESGQRLREAIAVAEQMAPCIVFWDEIDGAGRRAGGVDGDSGGQEMRRVFNQLLEWLGDESRKAILIGTTNRPQDLDPAFLRPGRFDYKIPFLFPGAEARRQILEIHLGLIGARPRAPLGVSGEELQDLLKDLAARTENFSGAEIEQLVLRAKRSAFSRGGDDLTQWDFTAAFSSFLLDREKREAEREAYLRQAEEFTDDRTFLKELRSEK